MKKLILFIAILFFAFNSFSQERSSAFNKIMLQQYKALPVNNSKARDYVIDQAKKDMANIKDSVMLSEYQDLIDELNKKEFKEVKGKPLSSLSKSDLKGFKVKEDKFKKMTFITPYGSLTGGKDPLEIYLAIDEYNNVFKRLKINYSGKDWVFMDKLLFLINDKVYKYSLVDEPERDVSGSYVHENADELILEELDNVLAYIFIADGPVSIRFQGNKYVDQKLTPSVINRLKKSDELYEKLVAQ